MNSSGRLFLNHSSRERLISNPDGPSNGFNLNSEGNSFAALFRGRDSGISLALTRLKLRATQIAILMSTCFIASVAPAQDLSAFITHVYSTTYEENNQSELDALEVVIEGAINSSEAPHFDYDLDSRGKTRLNADFSSLAAIELTAKQGTGFDFEAGSPFTFSVIGTRNSTAQSGHVNDRLDITVTITGVDEKPEVLPAYSGEAGRVFYIQKNPDRGRSILPIAVREVFRDPEGSPMTFKACADDFMIVEEDMAGTELPNSVETPNPRGSFTQDAHPNSAETGTSRHCPTVTEDPNTYVATRDVTRNGQVVNVTTTGPTIRITPVAATGSSGVHRAVLTFRGWVGNPVPDSESYDAATDLNISEEAKISVYVKTGENNRPQFAGGALGYRVEVDESTDDIEKSIGPQTAGAWNAGDLDGDELTYRLEGSAASLACRTMPDGEVIPEAVALGRGCAWVTLATGTNNVEIKGRNIDYESAPPNRTYVITLVASDGYNLADDARVPISIVVQNVDEGLEYSGPISQISQLVLGRAGRSVDLNAHFTDPDGTPITYTATSNDPSIVGVSLQGSILTVNPTGIAGTASVFITASSGGAVNFQSITVSVRETNQPPNFVGGVQIVNAQDPVSESAPTGFLVRVPGMRYNDPDGDKITASVVNSSLFEAVVDPTIGTQTHAGEVALKVTGRLDYETNPNYTVNVQLNDGWDISVRTVQVIVTIANVNEPPEIAKDAQGRTRSIPDQTVAVNGTGAINAADYFTDPEGRILRFSTIVQSGSQFVSVDIAGFSTIEFEGLLATGDSPATILITATDPDNLSATLTFRVFVSANNPPQLVQSPPNQTLRVGAATTVPLGGTFVDNDEGDRVARYEASSNNESVVLAQVSNDGLSMVLIPRAEGSTTVVITAIDTRGGRATTTVSVTVLGNVPPVINTAINTVELRPNAVAPAIDLTNHFSDPDGDTLSFVATSSQPNFATVAVNGNSLTIHARDRGIATITVTASDPDGESVRMTFLVAVINDAPTAQTAITLDVTHRGDEDSVDLSTIFSDPDNDVLSYEASIADSDVASVSIQGSTLTVMATGIGESEVTVTATDEYGLMGVSTFTVTVENQAPIVVMEIDDQNTDRTMMIMVDLSMVFEDPDGDTLTYTAMVDSAIATASIAGSTLTINSTDVGSTTVTVTASDEFGGTVSTSFDVTVVNLAPVVIAEVANFSLQVGGEAQSQDVASAFEDDDGMPLVITAMTASEAVATASVDGTTVSVAPVSRGGTMVQITATDVHGASVSMNVGVSVSDSEIKGVANTALASFSRSVLSSVSSTLGARLLADADGLYTPLLSYSLDDFAPSDNYVTTPNHLSGQHSYGIDNSGWAVNPLNANRAIGSNEFNRIDSLLGRGFSLKLAAAGDPTFWSVWGGVDTQSFEAADHEGSANSFYFGADMTLRGQWTFGIGIGRTTGEVDYSFGDATQTMDNELTQILPYARVQPSDRTSIYAVLGVGSGSLETTVVGTEHSISDLKGTLGLFGGRQVMLTSANGLNLAIVGDVGFSNLETDEGSAAANSLLAEVGRIRGGLETSFNMLMGADGSFTPFVTVGFRSDSGDGLAETGVEISGGIRITNAILSLDANFRTLVASGADDYSESGFAIMAALNPSAGATGLSISLSPSWGASTARTNTLWQDDFQVSQVPDISSWGIVDNERMKLDSTIGYGFLVYQERFLLTPYIDVRSGYAADHDFSVGAKLSQFARNAQNLDLSVKVGEDSQYTGTQQGTIKVDARLNF